MLCVAAMEPPYNQKYVCVTSANFRSTFTLRCRCPVPRPPVLRLFFFVAGSKRASGECAHLVLQGSDVGEKVGYLFGGG